MMEVGDDNNRRKGCAIKTVPVCSSGGLEEIVHMCISHESFTPEISYCEFVCR